MGRGRLRATGLPDDVESGSSKKTAMLTRHAGKRESDGALSWKEHVWIVNSESLDFIKGLTPYQLFGMLTSQRKKENM